jgi:hypothetical protein
VWVVTSQTVLDGVGGGLSVTATPEPGTLGLLGVGLLGMLVGRRRRSRRPAAA